ncbi:Demethylrebeccamycin-D-glucose O-methyltransferase [Streptomyces sp. enrichment culture]|uniref:SAM-dependent methyltransferase n=1 Tax=Streptomyces xiamenensis TaxID=408015 RepID=UPI0037CEF89E
MTTVRAPIPEQVGLLYDKLTDTNVLHFGYWENADDETPLDEAAGRLTDLVAGKLGLAPGHAVLDVGCGIGTPGVRVARTTGTRVTGVTISRTQVDRANELAAAEGLSDRATFQHADAMDLPFPAESFDAAFALESIIHMDRVKALRSIRDVLRPGAALALTDVFQRAEPAPGKPSLMTQMVDIWMMSDPVRFDDYPALLAEAGLELVELTDVTETVLRRTLLLVAEQMRAQDLSHIPDEIVASFPEEERRRLLSFPDELAASEELGCLVLVARRPAE